MRPESKLNSLTLSIVVLLMFTILKWVIPYLEHLDSVKITLTSGLISILSAVGLYKITFSILISLMENWHWLKKKILANYYVEGTWVGFFIGRGKDTRYVIETFEQDLHTIQIKGHSYTEQGELHAQWTSESVTIDVEKGRLIYSYTCDIISREVTLQGLGIFDLKRKNKNKLPFAINGYVADLLDGKRLPVHEIKIGDEVLSLESSYQRAKEFVSQNKEKFN